MQDDENKNFYNRVWLNSFPNIDSNIKKYQKNFYNKFNFSAVPKIVYHFKCFWLIKKNIWDTRCTWLSNTLLQAHYEAFRDFL